MYGLRVANRYAKALLEYALLQNALEGVFADMTLIDKTIKMNKDLERMLISPIVKTTVKKNVLTEIFTMVTPETQRLFDLLIQNRRLPILGAVAEKFVVLYNDYKHNKTAVVTTASPLNEATRKEILEKVMMLTKNKNVTLENKVDKNIIGGFILRVDDVQYNASVAHKLSRLQQEFQEKLFL
ncbi:MAG: ATP synthase F1 subunit delta [Capnocytophaga ochracea]|jgi:ATP synthase F1, delta subunit|uniref:ATP synthase F1 subunit delta n=1 Tax=Capnocytophaga sp. oral taxon 380 TaxID=712217 RepID=UPI0002A1B139|nr:ATP synthase F1 subunit delta [Capnocytophaga sp. oral taxon 380]EKY10446.1 ATP synthase F1, delta subunit [Capnocytophaga sp. oral taxon 380 str. F0488]